MPPAVASSAGAPLCLHYITPYSSNLTVALRRAHSSTQLQVYASVLHYLGA